MLGEIMELENAKKIILNLWLIERKTWKNSDYTTYFQIIKSFYDKLEQNNTELLSSFSHQEDKWQIVNKWIQEYEKMYNS